MKKEFMRILLDSCDKKRLVDSLVEMVRDEDQLSWIMGMVPNMDEQFVANHYSGLLAVADMKFDSQKTGNVIEKVAGKVVAANCPWDLPCVEYVVKRKVFTTEKAKEECDMVSARIEEYLAENDTPSFDELGKLTDKYPYCSKRLEGSADYPCETTYYSVMTVYLYSDDIAYIVEE